jgi:hypothetical protein
MDGHPDPAADIWRWLIDSLLALVMLVMGALLRGYDNRLEKQAADHAESLAEVKADNVKLWEHVTKADQRDRERWERFEERIEAKFDSLRALIMSRFPHLPGSD